MWHVPRIMRTVQDSDATPDRRQSDAGRCASAVSGFTLIELLVAVAVVAILAAIAVPSYQSFILKSRREDAKTALAALQMAQEKYRGNNLYYTTDLAALGLTAASPQGFYTIEIQSAGDSGYAATASATGPQSADTDCLTLAVAQTGFSTVSSSNPSECWGL